MARLKMLVQATGAKVCYRRGSITPVQQPVLDRDEDRMLERAREVTRHGPYTYVEYARFADDLVILWTPMRDTTGRWIQLIGGCERNWPNSRSTSTKRRDDLLAWRREWASDFWALSSGECGVLRVNGERTIRRSSSSAPHCCASSRTSSGASTPVQGRVVQLINPVYAAGVNYFAIGSSSRCFSYVKMGGEEGAATSAAGPNCKGFGWKRWSRRWLYDELGLFNHYQVCRHSSLLKALPAR